jgi:hypothetical protein
MPEPEAKSRKAVKKMATPWYKTAELSELQYPELLKVDKTSFIFGAELEIEAINGYQSSTWFGNNRVIVTEDGSLRNSGKEFLLPPSTLTDGLELFVQLHKNIRFIPDIDPFSQRTSTHVHVNCLNLDAAEIKTFILLYAIFEELAFNYVGPERRYNIHCVPLNFTFMPSLYRENTMAMTAGWSKYTALNLLPLRKYGTVEFRHLEGTDDPQRFYIWVEFLSKLYYAAIKFQNIREGELTNPKMLRELCDSLLTPEFIKYCKEKPKFVLEDNLLDVKLAFIR